MSIPLNYCDKALERVEAAGRICLTLIRADKRVVSAVSVTVRRSMLLA